MVSGLLSSFHTVQFLDCPWSGSVRVRSSLLLDLNPEVRLRCGCKPGAPRFGAWNRLNMAKEAKKKTQPSLRTSGLGAGSAKIAICHTLNLNLGCGLGLHPVLQVCKPDCRQSTNFTSQKSQFIEFITSWGHICDFYTKNHCEMNFIEQYWRASKYCYYLMAWTTNIVEMEKNVLVSLDDVPMQQICQCVALFSFYPHYSYHSFILTIQTWCTNNTKHCQQTRQ